MPEALKPVNPGDLITADYMNEIVDRLNKLERFVEQLEPTGGQPSESGPIIDEVRPARVSPGDSITIMGQGFSSEASENRVTIGGFDADVESGTSKLLLVQVPEALAAPQTTTVSVAVRGRTAMQTISVVPAEEEPDDLFVITGVSPSTLDVSEAANPVFILGKGFGNEPDNVLVTVDRVKAKVEESTNKRLVIFVSPKVFAPLREGQTRRAPVVVTINEVTRTDNILLTRRRKLDDRLVLNADEQLRVERLIEGELFIKEPTLPFGVRVP